LFVNHASLLIKNADRYLLTDPWHQRPAFGSWLPTFQQYVHPTYFAALGNKLSILISHGHDDHCDDDLLRIFDKDTEIVTAAFNAPSVLNRLRKLGFANIKTTDDNGLTLKSGFTVKSYVNPERSLDDATYSIDTGSGFVLHCNDNWFEFDADTLSRIGNDRARYANENIAFFSQTNSASGHPLSYKIFDHRQKISILRSKVKGMVVQGMKNADALGLNSFYSYAGFASVFVKGMPAYLELGLVPTAKFIRDELLDDAESKSLLDRVNVRDLYPGDVLDLSDGKITKAFISSVDYADRHLKDATVRYYDTYGIVSHCDTYRPATNEKFDQDRFLYFLENLNEFVGRKIHADAKSFDTVVGKSLEIVLPDLNIIGTIVFGGDVYLGTQERGQPNKRITVDSSLMSQVLHGEILFENLYTGYEAQWERFPSDVYNRDIVMFVVMYSYVYKNRLAKMAPPLRAPT
jgi:Beta-lactamase superfamily domain